MTDRGCGFVSWGECNNNSLGRVRVCFLFFFSLSWIGEDGKFKVVFIALDR